MCAIFLGSRPRVSHSSIEHGCLSAVFKIGSKFLIRIFFRTFYKNGFSELVKILVIILVFRIGFSAFHKNGYYDEKNFNFLIPYIILMIKFYH